MVEVASVTAVNSIGPSIVLDLRKLVEILIFYNLGIVGTSPRIAVLIEDT